MARIRTIRPEFPHSESMGRISREARLLFVLMWTLADDAGRLRGSSRALASLLFPYDDDAPALVPGWLGELSREGCVDRYQVDGQSFVQIRNWLNYQKIDRPSQSKFPSFDEGSRVLDEPSRGLVEGSSEEGKGREGKGEESREASLRGAPRVLAGQSPNTREETSSEFAALVEVLVAGGMAPKTAGTRVGRLWRLYDRADCREAFAKALERDDPLRWATAALAGMKRSREEAARVEEEARSRIAPGLYEKLKGQFSDLEVLKDCLFSRSAQMRWKFTGEVL